MLRPIYKVEAVEIEGFGPVHMRGMVVHESDAYQDRHVEGLSNGRSAAYSIMASVCDESGNLLFSEADLEGLLNLDTRVAVRFVQAFARINGFDDDAQKKD